ncbi:AHH domain-containing protein [Carnobacterium maltaromaticum]|uniref:AHH domain-containing protein n=1 Tax=Carnobacterium maltaromaticum TaxID=2751 RepID=UPI001E308E5A|nr:AHH domain-containing protein [Carnobacterium maltaromaticum]
MPKIDYQELKSLSDELTALRQTTVSHLEDYEQSNDAFTSDTILTGTAWDSGKGYHKNYKIISRSIFNALYDIDDAFKAHLAAFKGVVGEAENRLDTDELVELENELRRLQTQKLEFMEAMAEVFKDVPILKDFFAQNTMNGTIKEIELLKRYEHFENTTQGSFDGVYETIGAITEALAFMGESKNFAGGSKGYNEVNFAALGWHQQLDKYNQANEEDRYEIREIKTKYGTFYQVLKNGKVQKEASEALQYSELLDALGGMAKLTPEILKILVGLDDVEILLDDGSTTVQKMGSSMWLLLSVLPPDKIKDILKSAKLAKNSGKALDGIHITEKQWNEYKALDKSATTIGRLVPGEVGKVTGGSSTKLGKNLLESMGVKKSGKWSGYQAQHIIPSELGNHSVIKKMGMDLDDATNGIFLRVPDDATSAMSRHRGYHSTYSEVVKRQLDKIDINLSPQELQEQVAKLQQNLKKLQESGLPLYPSQGATVEMWERHLTKLN